MSSMDCIRNSHSCQNFVGNGYSAECICAPPKRGVLVGVLGVLVGVLGGFCIWDGVYVT